MRSDGPAALAVQRAADRELRKVDREAEQYHVAHADRIGYDSHALAISRICEEGFERAANSAARTLVGLKKQRAAAMSQYLMAALGDVTFHTMGIYRRNGGRGTPASIGEELARRLNEIAEGVCEDLEAGVFQMSGPDRHGATTIHFHDAATNVAIATDGSIVTVEGGQNSSTGVSVDELLDALREIESRLVASNAPQEEIDVGLDVLVNAQREIEAASPDAGRLKRFFKAASDVALKLGMTAATEVIARFIAIHMGASP